MHLLYVDESGTSVNAKNSSACFVLAGVALHEEDVYPFAQSLLRLQRRVVGPDFSGLELHASRVWAGRNEWAPVPRSTRLALITEMFAHLGSWVAPSGRAPRYFAVCVDKASAQGRNVLELAHDELFARFDSYLTRLHRAGDSHRSLVIADRSGYEAMVQRLMPGWKRVGSRIKRMHSMVEVPLYVDSKASPSVQGADFLAWAVWNYFEHRHISHLQAVLDRFDVDYGALHGLVHHVRAYTRCRCVACTSRREGSVPPTVPALF